MHRSLLVLVATCVFAAMLFPATASAAKWVVKNPSGVKMGTVVRKASRTCDVFSRDGTRWGNVGWLKDEGAYLAGMWLAGDTGLRRAARLRPFNGGWSISPEFPYDKGSASKKAGRWVVKTTADGRVRGSTPKSCPGWVAAGAVFILSRHWKEVSH